MKDFPIPVVALGAGSQPEEDEVLEYMALPKAMMSFEMPSSEIDAPPSVVQATFNVIQHLRESMMNTPLGDANFPNIDLTSMDHEVVTLLNQTLGEGEVSVAVREPVSFRIQETVFASVWRSYEYDKEGRVTSDLLSACAIPPVVIEYALSNTTDEYQIPEPTPGVMNAPALLVEIYDKAQSYKPGVETHVINLTLLPMSMEDMDFLTRVMGTGSITVLSRGYGNCRITSTKIPNVWWVQYFNSMDALILNTIEITAMPEVALAAKEDYADSVERLGEWLNVMQEIEAITQQEGMLT